MSSSGLDHHLATCSDCARWLDDVSRLTRRVRLGSLSVPDRADAISHAVALPAGRVLRRRLLLRVALAVVGVAQFVIALPAIGGDSLGMTMATHAAHEGAAWNLAIAVAFVAGALRPRRAAGLVPLLATFVVVLGALSVRDIAAGAVPLDRVCVHLAALAGLVLLVALDRAERALPPRGRSATGAPADTDAGSSVGPDGKPNLRGVA